MRVTSLSAVSASSVAALVLASTLALGALFAAGAARAQSPLSGIRTVFVIVMENKNWGMIKGSPSAPYINGTLLPMASHAENYVTPLSPSLPNYLWMEAGTNFGIVDDEEPAIHAQSTTAHLATQLATAGISWKSYQEGISGTVCPLVSAYPYAARHNPFVYFKDVTSDNDPQSAYCIAHNRPMAELATDLAAGAVPRYAFITPGLCGDGHDACAPTNDPVRQIDDWLRDHVPAIMDSQAYRAGGALFVTFDEPSTEDFPIAMIALSPFAKGYGYANAIRYDHSSLLRTLQEIFGVGPLLGGAAQATSLADLFQPVAVAPPACTLEASPPFVSLGGTLTLSARCQPAATSFAWTPAPGLVASGSSATVAPPATGTFVYAVTGMNGAGRGNPATTSVVVTTGADGATVVEFHNPDLDHYFITADPVEQAFVDSGAVGRWQRTGTTFKAGGPQPVCRFYGNAAVNPATGTPFGPNSHFYTASSSECAFLKSIWDASTKSWRFESNDFPATKAPGGVCPPGTQPIYRAYNDGFAHGKDSNHRITPSPSGIQEVVARGWKDEGVVMCAPG
jgi:hypothetical protein